MKAAPFAYARPTTVEEAVEMLAATGGEGKVLAGGQSLVPILAMRLARPSTLVDLNGVEGLDRLTVGGGGGGRSPAPSGGDGGGGGDGGDGGACVGAGLVIGAMVRQRQAERSPLTGRVPLLGMALPWVGHRELRSRGTIGGSLAHADPAAELPAVACCAEATFEITGPDGTREVAARDFFAGAMTTAVGPAEILTAVRFPVAEDGDGFGFAEVARRHGDFALAGVAVRVRRGSRSNGIGSGVEACLTAFGVSDRPVTADVTEALTAALSGVGRGARAGAGGAGAGAGAGEEAALASALIEPMVTLAGDLVDTSGDPHGSPAYRRRLVTHLAATQIACAYQRSGKPLPASDP